jgi:hypothetical protein
VNDMAGENQRLNFITRIDNSTLKSDAEEAKKAITGIGDKALSDSAKLDNAVKKVGKSIEDEGRKLNDYANLTKENINIQKTAISTLEKELKKLKTTIDSTAPGMGQQALVAEYNKLNAELNVERNTLKAIEDQVKKTVEKHTSLRTELMNIRNEMGAMVKAGQEGSEAYLQLQKRAGELNDQYKDIQQQMTVLADDERGFKAVTSLVTGLTGAFAAGQGIIGLFGKENEDLQKVMLKVQSAMAITIGLQQVAETLNKDSYANIVILRRGKELLAAAEMKLATAFGVSTAAARVMMATLTLGLSAAITTAIVLISKLVNKQKEARKAQEEFNKSVAEEIAKPVVQVELLSKKWTELGDNIKAKEKFIKDNSDTFEQLGVNVQSVADAENLLVNNTQAFIQSQIAKAKALAVTDKAVKLAAEQYEIQAKLETTDKTKKVLNYNTGQYEEYENSKYRKLKKRNDEIQEELVNLYTDSAKYEMEALKALENAGIKPTEKVVEEVTKKTEKAAKERYNAEAELQERLIELRRNTAKLIFDQRQDDLQKRLDEVDIENTEELRRIEEFQKEVVEKYNKDNPGRKVSSVSQIDPGLAKQYEEEIARINQFYSDKKVQIQQEAADEIRSIMGGVSEAFLSDQMLEVKAVQDKYKKIREELKKQGDLSKQQEGILKLAEDNELGKKLADITKNMIEEFFKDFDLSFTNLDSATIGQLKQVADKIRAIQLDKQPLLDAGITEEQITRLEAALDGLKSEATGNVNTAKLSEYNDIFGEIGGMMQQASDEFVQAIGKMVSAISDSLSTLMDKNASGFQKVTGIISLAVTVGNELAKIRRDDMNAAAEKQMDINKGLADQITLEAEISRMRRERADQEGSAILGPTFGDQMKDAIDDAREAQKLMDNALGSLMNNAVFTAEGKAKRRLFGTKKGDYSFSMADIFGGDSGTLGSEWGDIFGSGIGRAIKAGDAKAIAGAFLDPLQIFGGYADDKAKGNAFKNLQTAFDKTFQAMGKTSSDIAKMTSQDWVDFYSLMDEMGYVTDQATQEMIDQAKAASEEYAKAMEELKAVISDIAGALGNSLSSSLVEAFKSGEDAALALEKTVSGVLDNLISQMLFSVRFKPLLDQLEKEMTSSMDIGGDQSMTDDIVRFFKNAGPAATQFTKDLASAQEEAKKYGLDIFQGEDAGRKAVAKGLSAAMTQDSADRLDGLFTSVQGHTYSIQNDLKILVNNNAAMLRHLSGIETNTQNLARLTKIESDISVMRSGIDTIALRGVKILTP